MLDHILSEKDQGTAKPQARPAPSPHRGEGVPPCRGETPCSPARLAPTRRQHVFFVVPLCATLGAIAASNASAQDNVANFYAGKSIRLVVGIDVGSGYDVNAPEVRVPRSLQ